jgi:hypothetical protein
MTDKPHLTLVSSDGKKPRRGKLLAKEGSKPQAKPSWTTAELVQRIAQLEPYYQGYAHGMVEGLLKRQREGNH